MPKLGGIELIDRILREETHEGLVAAAAFALGTAASNNPTVQAAALSELSLMRGLLQVKALDTFVPPLHNCSMLIATQLAGAARCDFPHANRAVTTKTGHTCQNTCIQGPNCIFYLSNHEMCSVSTRLGTETCSDSMQYQDRARHPRSLCMPSRP